MRISCNLGSPDLPQDSKIHKILDIIAPGLDVETQNHYWDAECFGLQNTWLYTSMNHGDQQKVLNMISQSLLEEAYFIEKAGIAFAAKMSLLSESTQERLLYSHFAHQEANHLNLIRPFLESVEYEKSEFTEFMADAVDMGDKQCLTYIVQILLEGYGLRHYKMLASNCNHTVLKVVLDHILNDEAQHYRSGVELFDASKLTKEQTAWIMAKSLRFEIHINKGPIHIINALMQVYGKLHVSEYNQLLKDLKVQEQIDNGLFNFNALKEI